LKELAIRHLNSGDLLWQEKTGQASSLTWTSNFDKSYWKVENDFENIE
jgi:hypothetical protein